MADGMEMNFKPSDSTRVGRWGWKRRITIENRPTDGFETGSQAYVAGSRQNREVYKEQHEVKENKKRIFSIQLSPRPKGLVYPKGPPVSVKRRKLFL